MRVAARIFLLFTGVLLLAHYLPAGYWLVMDRSQRVPAVFYSCINKDFLLFRSSQGTVARTDPAGRNYERDEFEQLLPLDNYMQLYKDGRMPKEIDGTAITPEKLRRERVNVRLKPEALDSPSVPLTPLLELENGRVRLEMPVDFMRLGSTVEFIEAKSNQLLSEKTAMFQQAFVDAGFVFPIKVKGGNPSTLKPYDEGYYLVDAKGTIFRLRQVRGQPELLCINKLVPAEERHRWAALNPRFIHVQEQDNREIRALIVGEDGRLHLVIGADYRLITVPLTGYDAAAMQVTLRGDMLNRLLVVSSSNYIEALALNRNYDFVDRYIESLPPKTERNSGRIAATLFPFTLEFETNTSGFLGFHFAPGNTSAIALNLVFLAGLAGWCLLRKRPIGSLWPELASIGLGGLFGFVMVCLLPCSAKIDTTLEDDRPAYP